MVIRTVKLNLKHFLEDFMYSIETNNTKGCEELSERFRELYNDKTEESIKEGIRSYVTRFNEGRGYDEIDQLIDHF